MPEERLAAEGVLADYGDAIFRLAYSYLHSRPDAEDILQDTLVQYLTRRPTLWVGEWDVTLKGADGAVSLAAWTDGAYTYVLSFETPADAPVATAIIESVGPV